MIQAISVAPRGKRAMELLNITVGAVDEKLDSLHSGT